MPNDNRPPGGHNTNHAAIAGWLKAHGHNAARVDREVNAVSAARRGDLVAALCRLHGNGPEYVALARAGT